jgi:hypothetical protein
MGSMVASNQDSHNSNKVAVGLAIVGFASKIASAATTPQADIRTWDNLPQYLSFAALSLAPGEYPATLEFMDASGQVVQSLTQLITISVPPADPSVGSKTPDVVVFCSELKK